MQVADVRNASHDRLAIELEHEAKHTVRRGMLRADVDQHMLAAELRLEHRRLFHRDRKTVRVGHQRRADGPAALVEPARGERDLNRALRGRHYSPVRSPAFRR